MPDKSLTLFVLPDMFAICRFDPASPIPDWAMRDGFFSVTRTADELSVVCDEDHVPSDFDAKCERGWRVLKLEGPFDLSLIGILKSVLDPLAEARVGIFTISTYDTDYVLVKAVQFEQAITTLTRFGHTVRTQPTEVIEVGCGWRLPDGSRATAVFRANVIEFDAKQDRWLVKFAGVRAPGNMDATTRALIESQVGKWAYVPSEARRGLMLPLKYETLTGAVRWFYADDPRTPRA